MSGKNYLPSKIFPPSPFCPPPSLIQTDKDPSGTRSSLSVINPLIPSDTLRSNYPPVPSSHARSPSPVPVPFPSRPIIHSPTP